MRKILVLLAHPKYEHSHVNLHLTKAISGLDNVDIRDLYQLYPDFSTSTCRQSIKYSSSRM